MNLITTFPARAEFEKVKDKLDELGLGYDVVYPSETYSFVGNPAIIAGHEVRGHLFKTGLDFICSGWVNCPELNKLASNEILPHYNEDIFGKAAIMVVAPCVADPAKIRLIAHTEGDISLSFPYINAEMKEASFNKEWSVLSFMDSYRMVSLYQNRITAAKVDDIIDGWRVLEKIRRLVNETYSRRNEIEPSYEMRKKPPVLEIFKRLPGTNCRECGEQTCMAFASKVWAGERQPSDCVLVLEGKYSYLKEAFLEICAGMGTGQIDQL
jgi:ArsR family metal-binding transcriptional regulator